MSLLEFLVVSTETSKDNHPNDVHDVHAKSDVFFTVEPQPRSNVNNKKHSFALFYRQKRHVTFQTRHVNSLFYHPEFIRAEFWPRRRAPMDRSASYETGSGARGTISFRMCDFGPLSKLPERQNKNTAHTSSS